MTNPFVFIVGCPRSGTTLLRRVVNAHPQIAITPESHWVPRLFEKRKGMTPEGFVTPKLISRLLRHPRFVDLQIGRDELDEIMQSNQPISYSSFVTSIFELYGKARGKPLVGDKTPGYVRKLHTLRALWPTVRFVHLIRDGREVCLSMLNWPKARKEPGNFASWKDDPVSTAALWWELNVRLGREAGKSIGPDQYYEIRYDSLVSDPEEQCAALCAFLGVAFDDSMLRFHEGQTKSDPGLDAKHAWRPITAGLRDWRSQMPPEDVERFEAAAGELLGELGYPRGVPNPRAKAMERAANIRDGFAQAALERAQRSRTPGGEEAGKL